MSQITPEQDAGKPAEAGRTPLSDSADKGHHHGPKLDPDEEKPKGVNTDSPLSDPDAK